jgi:SulP family sulfate permease
VAATAINQRLKDAAVTFRLCEVKGPVMDRLKPWRCLGELTGQVFLSQVDAMRRLAPDCTSAAARAERTHAGRVTR